MPNQIPAGYAERMQDNLHVVARSDVLEYVTGIVREAGSLYAYALQHSVTQLPGGRAPVAVLERPEGESWAVRHYWRGGLVAPLLRDRYMRWGTPRPMRELRVQHILRSRGVATPQVVAVVTQEHGMWYRGDVATLMIPGALDLAALTLGPDRWPQEERERAWFAVGVMLHRFFGTGAVHSDLNLRNILVQRESGVAYLLDLDSCEVGERMRKSAVDGMLARFHRSRRKLERVFGASVAANEMAAMKRGRGV